MADYAPAVPEHRCFNAYIDEAGDEGFTNLARRGPRRDGDSSLWLILAAVLVLEEQDRERTAAVDRLRALLNRPPPKPLHWRDLKTDHTKKRRAIALLAAEPLVCSFVALWKPGMLESARGLRRKGYLYNYAARLLVERLSWFARGQRRRLNLLFEHRASTSYADLHRYMADMESDSRTSIEPGSIAAVSPVESSRKGAQLADYYVSATREALEPDAYGLLEERYLLSFRHQLYRPSGKSVFAYGFKIFPDLQGPDRAQYPWLDELDQLPPRDPGY